MLYVLRHGRTDWNDEHKLQGRTDIPLNDTGRTMAVNAGELYKNVHFDICFFSPLIRARETAEILLKGRNVPIVFDDRLLEMSFGEFEGVKDSFGLEGCPINVIFKNPENYTESIGGAETFEELEKRTGEFLREKALPLHEEGKSVLIVGHGAMNSSIVSQIKKLPREEFWSAGIENCKLMKLL